MHYKVAKDSNNYAVVHRKYIIVQQLEPFQQPDFCMLMATFSFAFVHTD